MKKLLLPLLTATALLGGCTTMADPFGGVFNDGPRGPVPVRDPYPGQAYPGQAYPGGPGPNQRGIPAPYHAVGTEPGWSLDIDARTMRFSGAYGQGPITVATPRVIVGFAGEIYQTPRLNVNIVHGRCSDGMSDPTYPDKVQVTADGRHYNGCGGPDDRLGSPGTMSSTPLADSRWHVVSINGRPTPLKGDYHVDFTATQLSARFGCNGMGARYTLDRDMLSTDGLIGTQMACADLAMRFESQGSAVLRTPARVRWSPGHLTLTNNAGIIELDRR